MGLPRSVAQARYFSKREPDTRGSEFGGALLKNSLRAGCIDFARSGGPSDAASRAVFRERREKARIPQRGRSRPTNCGDASVATEAWSPGNGRILKPSGRESGETQARNPAGCNVRRTLSRSRKAAAA